MTDGQLAWKATKVAATVFAYLFAFIVVVFGVTALAFHFLGRGGAGLLYLTFLFGIIWLCAALDIQGQEDCAASADTLPKGEDAKQASCASKGSAVAKPDAQQPNEYPPPPMKVT
jgi:hypothetical protein